MYKKACKDIAPEVQVKEASKSYGDGILDDTDQSTSNYLYFNARVQPKI